MLESMRKYHQSIFIYIVFGLLILVFGVNFGPGSTGCNPSQGSDYAAVVNGETIPREEWAQHYNRQIDMYKRMMQGSRDLDEAFLERLGVRQTVMNNLVGARLVAQEAKRRGIGVSDDELIKYLADVYGVKGEVTPQQYQNWVQRTFGLTVDRFEEQTKSELAAQKLASIVQEGVDVSDSELRASFVKEHDRAMATFVKFDPDALPKSAVSAAQVDKLLAEKSADVEARYKKDQFKYNTPKQQRVRQIVKSVAQDASDADVQKARGALLELKSRIDGGADFAAIAKEQSDDEATKDKGGDIGYVSAGQMARVLDEAVAKLKAGEITAEPVRTPRGLYLLQVSEIREASQKPFDEVKRDVAQAMLAEQQSDEAAQTAAKAFLAKLKGGATLESITVAESEVRDQPQADAKPTRQETPWVLKSQEAIPRIGASKELHDTIFALTKEAPLPGDAYKVGRSYYVVVYKDREIPDDAKFAATKETLRRDALSEKRDRVFRDWVEHLREKATVEVNPALMPQAPAEARG